MRNTQDDEQKGLFGSEITGQGRHETIGRCQKITLQRGLARFHVLLPDIMLNANSEPVLRRCMTISRGDQMLESLYMAGVKKFIGNENYTVWEFPRNEDAYERQKRPLILQLFHYDPGLRHSFQR